MALSLARLQAEVDAWAQRNFGVRPAWQPLVGIMEELGELAHAHLKAAQGIRRDEDHDAGARDAVGDIVIYVADYCNAAGYNLEEIVNETWAKVRQRDWREETEAER